MTAAGRDPSIDPPHAGAARRVIVEVITHQKRSAGAKKRVVQLFEWIGALQIDLPLFRRFVIVPVTSPRRDGPRAFAFRPGFGAPRRRAWRGNRRG